MNETRTPNNLVPQVSLASVSLLLLGSGFCALVYQTVWFRAFRLVFGASTVSTAAVLALFMAGLGLGSVMLGPRADRSRRPLGFYANLEFGIAALAAVSPLLVPLVYNLYGALGGNQAMGLVGGTLARLALAAPIVALPAWLMGGTLPAAARAIEAGSGRRHTGWIYGFNTLGAVLGVFATTFWALEHLGMRTTCLVAALLNVLVAMVARNLARNRAEVELDSVAAPAPVTATAAAGGTAGAKQDPLQAAGARSQPRDLLILAIAGLAGFAFFLLEIVWYRMLGPLMGGSTYTFGLILALALAGIGLGGLVYGAGSRARRPTLGALGATLLVEGLVVLLPFAAGDNLALLALGLRTYGVAGFTETIVTWILLGSLVVLPTAFVAGYQFPLLLAVLGDGKTQLGRHVGLAYGWNTSGAILGSLAGGFGLLPLLGASTLWRGTGLVLLLTGFAVAALGARETGWRPLRLPGTLVALGLMCAFAVGPTAGWRHSGIGAGRFQGKLESPNSVRAALEAERGAIAWEVDGIESSVALHKAAGYAFFVNGKSDGHAIGDAPTQILSGLVGAVLLPEPPKSALVIGLGTGSTAGWLGALPSMERVDVVELEPAILEVARACTPVNHGVFENPRIRIETGDAREVLMTTRESYDIIFSEPSNPYRAGIASLFSLEFYRAIDQRLSEGGVLVQWLQGYEIDPSAARVVYATLSQVFPAIETWQVSRNDLLLLATREPFQYDLERIAAQVREEPLASALAWTWGVEGLEGLFTGFIADHRLGTAIAQDGPEINTDDRSVLEFGFARGLGRNGIFSPHDLRSLAARLGIDGISADTKGVLDQARVRELLEARLRLEGQGVDVAGWSDDETSGLRRHARTLYAQGAVTQALAAWRGQSGGPEAVIDHLLVAEGLAAQGDDEALSSISALGQYRPADAYALEARLRFEQGRHEEALVAWQAAVVLLRERPWIHFDVGRRQILDLARDLARVDADLGRVALEELAVPFAVHAFEEMRNQTRLRLALAIDYPNLCLPVIRDLEPHPPWLRHTLELRRKCYEENGDEPAARRARRDLDRYLDREPTPLWIG